MKGWNIIRTLAAVLLFLLWAYTVYSKIAGFRLFQIGMRKQVFSIELADLLAYTLPVVEGLAAALLCFRSTRIYGFVLSTGLLLAFTAYIALIMSNVFGKVPCSCGGILEELGWTEHLIFNLAFLFLSAAGLYAEVNNLKERRT